MNAVNNNTNTAAAVNAVNPNAIEAYKNFRLPEMVDGADFTKEDLADDMDGLNFNFQKVKIPSGGTLQFELPGGNPENPDYSKTLEGVIIHNHAANAFWTEGSEKEEDATPLCSSTDGKCGIGEPGGDCVSCALNRFGSGSHGKGKACKNMRVLYLLRDGDFLPIQIMLPPTSIKPFSDFYNTAFALRRRGACGSIVSIGLKRMNNGKDDYSVVTLKNVFDFTGEQLAAVKAYADGFKNMIKMMNQEKSANAISRADDTPVYNGETGGSRVYVAAPGGTVNGDADDLPA